MTHVPYKDSASLYSDLFSGRIDVVFDFLPVMRPNVAAGKVRILAITKDERAQSAPSIPTLKERGYDVVFSTWSSLLMPAGTPPDVVAKMSSAVQEIFRSTELQKYVEENKAVSRALLGPDEMRAFIGGREVEMYKGLVQKAGVTAD